MLLQQADLPGAAQPHEHVRSPALELTADAWGAGRSWLLAHGAAQGNLAACLALRVARGRQAVVQRDVDASVVSGLIATETLSPYPRGVPAVLPGERLEADVVATLRAVVAAGGVVTGSADGLGTFGVVAGSQGGASRRPAQARRPRAAASVRWTR